MSMTVTTIADRIAETTWYDSTARTLADAQAAQRRRLFASIGLANARGRARALLSALDTLSAPAGTPHGARRRTLHAQATARVARDRAYAYPSGPAVSLGGPLAHLAS